MTAETYRKVVVTQFGRDVNQCLAIKESPIPQPSTHEVLVRNHFLGVNFSDIPMMMGRFHNFRQLPLDLGVESAGEVVAVGDGVEEIKVGDPVAVVMYRSGYREYTLMDANFVIPLPDLSPDVMSLVLSGTSASIALDVQARMRSGQTVLITAAMGGSGHYAAQLAKLADNHVIGTCKNADEARILHELHLDRVIIREQENLDDVLTNEYGGGINLVYDSFGGTFFDTALKHLAHRGRIITAGALAEHTYGQPQEHTIDVYNQLTRKAATIHGFSVVEFAQFARPHVTKLMDLFRQGKLRTFVDPAEFKGIDAVTDAIQHVMDWETVGKVIVRL